MVLQRIDDGVAGLGKLIGPDVHGAVDEPVADALDAACYLIDEFWCTLDELVDHEREDGHHGGQSEDEHERHGAAAGGAVAVECVDRGQQQGGEDQG